MAQSRKNVIALISFFALVGIAFASVPFLKSTDPVEQLPENKTNLNIADVLPDSSKLFRITRSLKIEKNDGSMSWHHGDALFLVKDKDSKAYLYYLPMWEGTVMMPQKHWWQHESYCSNLVAEFFEGKTHSFTVKALTGQNF